MPFNKRVILVSDVVTYKNGSVDIFSLPDLECDTALV